MAGMKWAKVKLTGPNATIAPQATKCTFFSTRAERKDLGKLTPEMTAALEESRRMDSKIDPKDLRRLASSMIIRAASDVAGIIEHSGQVTKATRAAWLGYLRLEALEWFRSSSTSYGSYLFCCQILDAVPSRLRRVVERYAEQQCELTTAPLLGQSFETCSPNGELLSMMME